MKFRSGESDLLKWTFIVWKPDKHSTFWWLNLFYFLRCVTSFFLFVHVVCVILTLIPTLIIGASPGLMSFTLLSLYSGTDLGSSLSQGRLSSNRRNGFSSTLNSGSPWQSSCQPLKKAELRHRHTHTPWEREGQRERDKGERALMTSFKAIDCS